MKAREGTHVSRSMTGITEAVVSVMIDGILMACLVEGSVLDGVPMLN